MRWLPELDAVSACTALNRIAKADDGRDAAKGERFKELRDYIVQHVHGSRSACDARYLANIAWSFSFLNLSDGPVLCEAIRCTRCQ